MKPTTPMTRPAAVEVSTATISGSSEVPTLAQLGASSAGPSVSTPPRTKETTIHDTAVELWVIIPASVPLRAALTLPRNARAKAARARRPTSGTRLADSPRTPMKNKPSPLNMSAMVAMAYLVVRLTIE